MTPLAEPLTKSAVSSDVLPPSWLVGITYTHPFALVAMLAPPVCVIFSLRLIRSIFRRGHLVRFLVAAVVLVIDGAVIVYLFERHAPGSNIHTLGDTLWWSFVTVTTVGDGDHVPGHHRGADHRASSWPSGC